MLKALIIVLFWWNCMAAASAPERIIFDTDSGPFNDDGVALVMLLQSSGKVSIEGITAVGGNVWPAAGAEYMLSNLQMMGRGDIPVFIGAQAPLVHTPAMATVAAERWGKQNYIGAFAQPRPKSRRDIKPPFHGFSAQAPHAEGAVPFIISAIDAHPGDVTFFAIGPMTNLAIALRLRPDLETKIKRLVFMGGAARVPGNVNDAAEFNFWFDPEAAQIVLRSRIPQKVMFGLDICNHAKYTKALFDQIVTVKTPVTAIYAEDFGRSGYPYFLKNPAASAYLWDELAAAFLIDPSFVTESQHMHLDVETRFGKDYGRVIPLDRKLALDATPVQVMLDLNTAKAFDLYKDLLTRPVPKS